MAVSGNLHIRTEAKMKNYYKIIRKQAFIKLREWF